MSDSNMLRGCIAVCAMCLFAGPVPGAPPSRIREDLANGRMYSLEGNIHPQVSSLPDKGSLPDQTPLPRITIDFKMSGAQQAALTKLLSDQQNPASPKYHKWLTPEQYGEQFGMSSNDLWKVRSWLQSQGFHNIQIVRSKNAIRMSGTVQLAQNAFRTLIHRFEVNGTTHYANRSDPYLPLGLQETVQSVRGLSDLHPKPRSRKIAHPHFTSSVTGTHFMAPGDFATIYDVQKLYDNGITGAGQKIAIAGQTDIQNFDIEAFQTAAGLTVQAPTVVLDGTDPGLSKDDLSEAELDVEWAGAVARRATIVYVNSSDAFSSAIYAIQNQLANVLSLTYGSCEAQVGTAEINTLNAVFQQAAAEGMTVVAAAGDSGAADCDYSGDPKKLVTTATSGLAVDFPASSPYVTGIGGTQFNEGSGSYWGSTNSSTGGSALSYIPEQAWNDDCLADAAASTDCTGAATYGLSASGGGVSTVFPKPSWQAGTGVPSDGFRDVPDVSLDASPNHDGFLVCVTPPSSAGVAATTSSCMNGTFRDTDSTLNVAGGTSIGAPTFAGLAALINQVTGSAQGNVNARLYALASLTPDAFHDITLGNNIVPCTVGTTDCASGILGYTTTAGYDQVTGLGTIDAYNLAESFAPSFTLSINPSTLTVGSSSSGTATVTVSALGGFTGTVSFSCSVPATLSNTTCSIPGDVTGSGATTLTISNSISASGGASRPRWSVPPGSANLVAFLAVIALLTTVALTLFNRKRRLPFARVAVLSAALMTGCGGGSSSSSNNSNVTTPAVTGTVTVTAVSAATSIASSSTKTITLSVTEP